VIGKKILKVEFKEFLKDYIDSKQIYGAVDELTRIVGENIIQKYNGLIGQNKFLVHQNKKLEDTKEYYIALYRGVEENANVLNDITNFVKRDISESSAVLIRKEAHHTKQTVNVNQKLEEILKLLEDIKINGK
jgi:signal transduction histidine kinase